MTKRNLSVFVDASAWIALAISTDALHQKAKDLFQELLQEKHVFLVTSDYVVDEVATRIKRKKDHSGAKLFLASFQTVTAKRKVTLLITTRPLFHQTISLFNQVGQPKSFSFTDASIIALMKRHRIKQLFTFDKDFQKLRKSFGITIIS